MSQAPRYIPHYTIADYEMWEGDWELWSGVPVAMTPSPNKTHQRVSGNIVDQIRRSLRENEQCPCEVLYELDWRVDEQTVVRPDIAVLCEGTDGEFIAKPPALVVEVISPSTASKDRIEKRRLYAEQGVGYYLMADPETRSLDVLKLVGDEYAPVEDDTLELHPGCSVTIDPAAIWPSSG